MKTSAQVVNTSDNVTQNCPPKTTLTCTYHSNWISIMQTICKACMHYTKYPDFCCPHVPPRKSQWLECLKDSYKFSYLRSIQSSLAIWAWRPDWALLSENVQDWVSSFIEQIAVTSSASSVLNLQQVPSLLRLETTTLETKPKVTTFICEMNQRSATSPCTLHCYDKQERSYPLGPKEVDLRDVLTVSLTKSNNEYTFWWSEFSDLLLKQSNN